MFPIRADLKAIKKYLTHWGRETHMCVGKLTIIASDNGLSPGRRQAIIWTNAGIMLIGPLGTNVSEISIGIQTFSFKKMHLNMSFGKWRPSCLDLNVLNELHCARSYDSIPCCLANRGTYQEIHWAVKKNYYYHVFHVSSQNIFPHNP